jgi:threonine 3-dehydrogenase
VDIFYYALRGLPYTCYLKPDAKLPMMYMPDCIDSTMKLLEAPTEDLKFRTYNISAYSMTPAELATAIKKYVPNFEIHYEIGKKKRLKLRSCQTILCRKLAKINE